MYASSNYSGKKIYSEKKNKPTIRLTITNFENEGHLFKKNKLLHKKKKECCIEMMMAMMASKDQLEAVFEQISSNTTKRYLSMFRVY